MLRIFALLTLSIMTSTARADMDHMFGYGSTTAALAGSNRARSYDAFTILQNPALMSFKEKSEMSTGFLGAVDFFEDLENVVIDNPYIGGSAVKYGNIETDVPDVFNFLLGSVWTLSETAAKWRLGMALNLPGDKVLEAQTKDIYQPQYAMYLSNTHRLGFNFALSRKYSEKFSVGAGVAYYLMTGATVQARLVLDNGSPEKTSTANLRMIVKPAMAPLFGMAYQASDNEMWTLNYKGVKDARVATKFDAIVGILGNAPLIFNASGSIFYDPETISLGYANVKGHWEYTMALDCERWSAFDGAAVKFEFESWAANDFHQYPFNTRYRDIWVPRFGLSHFLDPGYLRFGYAYKPSPTPELNGETNFLDSDRHIIGFGYDWEGGLWGIIDKPVRWSTHAQVHYLNPREVKKANATDIGAPGYTVRGYVVSYGINMTIDL